MPRISESTVKEHREKMSKDIFDAAEKILRTDGPEALTAAAVTKQVGIARNSLYRYVDSIDALRAQVVGKYLPEWTGGITAAVTEAEGDKEKVIAYVEENLRQASERGHIWMVNATQGLSQEHLADILGAHGSVEDHLMSACQGIHPGNPRILASLINAITNNGLTLIDAGEDPRMVISETVTAAAAITATYE